MRATNLQRLIGPLAAILISATALAQNQGDFMKELKQTQTLCLGRFLVDVPKDAYLLANPSEYRGKKISLTRRVSQESFTQLISDKKKTLEEAKHEKDPSLLKYISKSSDGNSVVFLYWKDPYSEYMYETEVYKWMKGYQFLIKGNSSYDRVSIAIDMANRTLSELQYRRDNEIPTTPGFCIDGGFFAGEPTWPHYEKAYFHLRFKKNLDVMVSIETTTNGEKIDEGLLARRDKRQMPEIYKEAAKEIKMLRQGKHPVGAVMAEEILETYPTDYNYSVHQFRWESSGKSRDFYAPSIVVKVKTGETKDSVSMRPSLSDQQAIELFDSIVNSIRVRPTGRSSAENPEDPKKPPPRPQAKAPLGTTLASGSRCPQSGLWQCSAANALGGDRRSFTVGETLPNVLVPRELSFWQKLKRQPENLLTSATWTLMAYANDTESA